MSLVSTKKMLKDAQKGGYAVGHFNTSNLEFTQAIIRAAEETNSPVIVATSVSAINYVGYQTLSAIVHTMAKQAKVPVALHLDHSPSNTIVKDCLKHGWTSIMRDASALSFKENIKETKRAVLLAKKFKVPVEAELGKLAGKEGWVESDHHTFTDPLEAKEFVKQTGCHSLAVSVGTSHGAYKFDSTPKLDLKRITAIAQEVSAPLVLHGASNVPVDLLRLANKKGANIAGAVGVPSSQVKAAIKRGICKVNTDTDLRIAFDAYVREYLQDNPKVFDPRAILGATRDDMQKHIQKRMKVLGSVGRA